MKNRKNPYEDGIIHAIWEDAAAEAAEVSDRISGKTRFTTRKVVSFAFASLVLCMLVTQTIFSAVIASQHVVTRTTLELGPDFSEVKVEYLDYNGNPVENPEVKKVRYEATYVPEGYELVDSEADKRSTMLRYCWEKNEGSSKCLLTFSAYSYDSNVAIGVTYGDKVEKCYINGYEGVLAKHFDNVFVAWATESAKMLVSGEISEEEALKMANSVQKSS
ncbi:MAG: DUF4367 domain-containing protein [Christensenellaceae bacterium]|nr:DUF4367 domain-containing protein [Christensenellaceae bacterium]